jgi:hypothetical protein
MSNWMKNKIISLRLITSECSQNRAETVVAVRIAIRVVEIEGASIGPVVEIASTYEPRIARVGVIA